MGAHCSCSQYSFLRLIKSILMPLANPFHNSHSLNCFQLESVLSSSSSCCTASPGWEKGLAQHYSPSTKITMVPMNALFAKADLASHVLRMCPHAWQDPFNLHKKGMTPVEMCLLLLSLETIERICTQDKSNAQFNVIASHKSNRRNKRTGTEATVQVPKKVCHEKYCKLFQKHEGAYIHHA
jgi:hypothetical protein